MSFLPELDFFVYWILLFILTSLIFFINPLFAIYTSILFIPLIIHDILFKFFDYKQIKK